jgi:hypothetical protein
MEGYDKGASFAPRTSSPVAESYLCAEVRACIQGTSRRPFGLAVWAVYQLFPFMLPFGTPDRNGSHTTAPQPVR